MKIAIDAGHGREGDPGAVNLELLLSEAQAVSVLRELIKEKLVPDFQVFFPDRELLSSQRAREAQENECQVLLSLHLNAGPQGARGCEIWYRTGSEGGKELALSLQGFLSELPLKMRGIKSDDQWFPPSDPGWKGGMGILREFPGPAVVIELLFISDPEEARLLLNPKFLENASLAIVKGLRKFFSLNLPFWDVSSGEVKDALVQLAKMGLIKGYPDGTFHPEKPLTRGEAAILFMRLVNYIQEEGRR
ncbi:MAG: N-acetylmuramoyl-L-alanine amidase [bacterium]